MKVVLLEALHLFLAPFVLMYGLSHLNDRIAEVPQYGYWDCFWVMFVVATLITPAVLRVTSLDDR